MNSRIKVFLTILSLFSILTANAEGSRYKRDPSRTNPNISVHALALGRAGNKGNDASSEAANGFSLQEVEMRFTSNIDSYFIGDILLALEKEPGEEFKIHPEEVFVETLSIPAVTIRGGKFKAILGRHNQLHRHAFPFIDPPLTNEKIIGEEGLNEVGVLAAYLIPVSWYSEFIAQGFSAGNENLFNSGTSDDIAGIFFLKNLWDLSDSSTIEFDLGYGLGKNSFGGNTSLYNVSATYKWRPIEKSTSQSVSITTEYLRADRASAPEDARQGGISTWVQWQFAKRWWLQGRGEYLGLPKPDLGASSKYSALIGFVPSEFSSLRLQYDNVHEAGTGTENRIALQLNVSLGSHPAHTY